MTHAHRRLAEATTAGAEHEVTSLGQPVSPQRFFNDVRATVLAIRGSWPVAREVFTDSGSMHAIAAHVDALRDPRALRTAALGDGRLARTFGHPPADPLQAAALMTLTVAILNDPNGHLPLARLLSGLPSTSTAHRRLRQHAPHCSPTMTAAIRTSVRINRAVGQPALVPPPATHKGLLDPRTIPADLPEHWAAPLNKLSAPKRQLRRDAAIRLVQMATGQSRASAARYFGITPGALHSSTVTIRAWQKESGNAEAYRTALQRIAETVIALDKSPKQQGGVREAQRD
jgi:hypothetical protein